MIDQDTTDIINQTMVVCLAIIAVSVAYNVHVIRKSRRKRNEILDVMWKKPGPPKISAVKEYRYDEPKQTHEFKSSPPPDSATQLNRAERRRREREDNNGSNTVNWAD